MLIEGIPFSAVIEKYCDRVVRAASLVQSQGRGRNPKYKWIPIQYSVAQRLKFEMIEFYITWWNIQH